LEHADRFGSASDLAADGDLDRERTLTAVVEVTLSATTMTSAPLNCAAASEAGEAFVIG